MTVKIKSFGIFLCAIALSFLSASTYSKTLNFDKNMSRLWLDAVDILLVDDVKPQKHLRTLDVAPGEHIILFQTYQIKYQGGAWVDVRNTYKVKASFQEGFTYAWHFDYDDQKLYFHDMGYNYVIPKPGLIGMRKEYLQAISDARNMPTHNLAFFEHP